MRKTIHYAVRLYPKQHEIIKKSAKKLGISEADFVRRAIEAAAL